MCRGPVAGTQTRECLAARHRKTITARETIVTTNEHHGSISKHAWMTIVGGRPQPNEPDADYAALIIDIKPVNLWVG